MTARPIPFAHTADEVARAIAFDKTAWRMGLISIEPKAMGKFRAVVTFNARRDAYVVDCSDEAVARWIGYEVGKHEGLEVGWQVTAAIGKHWIAQFYVCGKIGEAA